jgi:hypothetical protein
VRRSRSKNGLNCLNWPCEAPGSTPPDEIREINEYRMRARRRLGALLDKIERHQGPQTETSRPHTFRAYLKQLGLDKTRAHEAQRIATMPEPEFEKALAATHKSGDGVLDAWGFEFKTSAVWVKDKIGTGYIFRNRHELLLYATRGNMPAPQYQPESVFTYPRGEHSAKPPEVRAEIGKMYPDFNDHTRAELFARVSETIPGWSCYGFEAFDQAAE